MYIHMGDSLLKHLDPGSVYMEVEEEWQEETIRMIDQAEKDAQRELDKEINKLRPTQQITRGVVDNSKRKKIQFQSFKKILLRKISH